MMSAPRAAQGTVHELPTPLRHAVRIAGAIAGAGEKTLRVVMTEALGEIEPSIVDEIVIQSYLFAGFPRTLNAARCWRTVSGFAAPATDPVASAPNLDEWRRQGEKTCAVVYGESYEPLRENVRALHPALDEWMIADGYGKVLSRPGLELRIRELCIVAACAVTCQQRQLHSHLHGALNAGSDVAEIGAVLDSLSDLIPAGELPKFRQLLVRVGRA